MYYFIIIRKKSMKLFYVLKTNIACRCLVYITEHVINYVDLWRKSKTFNSLFRL